MKQSEAMNDYLLPSLMKSILSFLISFAILAMGSFQAEAFENKRVVMTTESNMTQEGELTTIYFEEDAVNFVAGEDFASVDFRYEEPKGEYLYVDDFIKLCHFTSSNPEIVYVEDDIRNNGRRCYIYVQPIKEGSATLTVTAKGCKPATISVHVSKNEKTKLEFDTASFVDKSSLSGFISFDDYRDSQYYKDKTRQLFSGSEVAMTIGESTYKTKIDSEGNFEFKNMKLEKPGTHFTASVSKNGWSLSGEGSLDDDTWRSASVEVSDLSDSKNTLTVTPNVEVYPGDYFIVTVGNETIKQAYKEAKRENENVSIKVKVANPKPRQKINATFYSYSNKKLGSANTIVWGPSAPNVDAIEYGDTRIIGFSTDVKDVGATVKVKIGKKTYKSKINNAGDFTIKGIPMMKPGSTIMLTINKYGREKSRKVRVGTDDRVMDLDVTPLFKNKTKITVKARNDTFCGDYVVVKIGDKTYKKVNKSKKKNACKKYSFKVKGFPAGQKIKIAYYNKYNKKLETYSSIVWRGKYIHVGDKPSQVRMTYGFGEPVKINSSRYSEQWVYGSKGNRYYVYFRKGKVDNWQL